ncbi:hypothetical protein LEMLEM_LOCUS3807, partial [Lemmus lemmus]
AQSGTESAPLPRLCLQPPAWPPTSRCLRQSLRASSLAPSAPAAASLLLFRLLRFPLLLLFLVLLLLLFLLLLFPHLLSPQPPPPTPLTPLPPGHPGPCRVFGPRSLCCGPLDPTPAALAPKLLGLKHRQTRRFLHALSSSEAVPCRLASRSLRWFRESGEAKLPRFPRREEGGPPTPPTKRSFEVPGSTRLQSLTRLVRLQVETREASCACTVAADFQLSP